MDIQKTANDWARFYEKTASKGIELGWPNENVIRFFKGSYIWPANQRPNFSEKSIIDVGCGDTNNTRFLSSLGLNVAGTEIHPDICELGTERMRRAGYDVEIKLGFNRDLPYPDASFDYLLSWNVLHYEGNQQNVTDAISEYARVIKPGGRIILSTVGTDNSVLQGARKLAKHHYVVQRAGDIRKGEAFFCFETEADLVDLFSPYFSDGSTGRITNRLFNFTIDCLLFTGIRRA